MDITKMLRSWRAEMAEELAAAETELADAQTAFAEAQSAARTAAAESHRIREPFAGLIGVGRLSGAIRRRLEPAGDEAKRLSGAVDESRRRVTLATEAVAEARVALSQIDHALAEIAAPQLAAA